MKSIERKKDRPLLVCRPVNLSFSIKLFALTNVMIQNFFINIKSILKSNYLNILDPLSPDEFETLETYCTNSLNTASEHIHYFHDGSLRCQSPNLSFYKNYSRTYITYSNNRVIDTEVTVPVFYCESCEHFHAVLPNFLVIPNCQFSLSFILMVLYDKFHSTLTVDEIINKYQISVSTLYRWMERYKQYMIIYMHLRNQYTYSMLISLMYIADEIIDEIFETTGFTLFQYDRRLFQP